MNNYFRFKQFTVYQDRCAMKVCTDACLFGAWVHEHIQHTPVTHALDIGCGTGLLSLMLAQQTGMLIDAVEIDKDAYEQARENIKGSPWNSRLQVHHGDIRSVALDTKFGLIISNPPFFENNLKSPDAKRNLALHSEQLALHELISIAGSLLETGGTLALLLPFHRRQACIETAGQHRLFLKREALVRQTEQHDFFRVMLCFSSVETDPVSGVITIQQQGAYSAEFVSLLKPYYLHL
jgi:tRNA1Val (adenine37-N6)-methyltransferase